VLQMEPKNYEAAIGLGVALRGGKKIDEAEAQYNAAQKLDPANPSSYFNLGLLYQDYKGGDKPVLEKAQEYYRQFLSKANNTTSDTLRRDAQKRIKDIDETFEALKEAAKLQAEADAMSLLPAMKAAIARVDKDLPLTRIRTMDDVAEEATSQPRFRAELVGVFAVLALMLAAVGIFGVLAFSVGQRAREFGIRVALGARSHDVLRLVLSGALKMTAAGVAIGLTAAALLTRFLGTLLFEIKPIDPITFAGTAGILATAALVACALPAWRATRVDPAVTLRQE